MKSNIIALNGIRPERWAIGVGLPGDNVISCFYSESSQCWAGLVYVDSIMEDERYRVMEEQGLEKCSVLTAIFFDEDLRDFFQRYIDYNLAPENRGW